MSGIRDDFWEKHNSDQSVKSFLKHSKQDEDVWTAVRDFLIEGDYAGEYWDLPEQEKERLEDSICHSIASSSQNPDFDCTMKVKTALKKWKKKR
jgi:hypothetical protein